MSTPLKKIEALLRDKFTNAEYEVLVVQPRFARAMKAAQTPGSFERLCEAGEEILKANKATNRAARQLRQGQPAQLKTPGLGST